MIHSLILPVIYAFFSSLPYALLFNIHGVNTLVAALAGAFGWLVYLVAGWWFPSPIIQSLFAGIAIAAFAEGMSRVRKCPVTGFLLTSFFPLVPGGGIYFTMKYCIDGNREMFYNKGLETLGIAGALAVGVLLVSSTVRLMTAIQHNRRTRKT